MAAKSKGSYSEDELVATWEAAKAEFESARDAYVKRAGGGNEDLVALRYKMASENLAELRGFWRRVRESDPNYSMIVIQDNADGGAN